VRTAIRDASREARDSNAGPLIYRGGEGAQHNGVTSKHQHTTPFALRSNRLSRHGAGAFAWQSVHGKDGTNHFTVQQVLRRLVDLFERISAGDQLIELESPRLIQTDEVGHGSAWITAAE
jgi:hypothetical protein